MTNYLVYNGDADGICAAHQYYLSNPESFQSVTGVKRDISLLKKVLPISGIHVLVFDIAVEKNLQQLKELLEMGAKVQWFDHHISEEIPSSPNLSIHIQTDSDTNTSKIVSEYLQVPSLWAVVGLFGDNMSESAVEMSQQFSITQDELALLKEAGELINYNGYGGSLDDLHFPPDEILKAIQPYANPLDFIEESTVFKDLRLGMEEDTALALKAEEIEEGVFLFPDVKWARRVIGVFANRKAKEYPDRAHAVLMENAQRDCYVVSIRSPLNGEYNAAEFCKKFPTGGGRVKAAGINELPKDEMSYFMEQYKAFFPFGS